MSLSAIKDTTLYPLFTQPTILAALLLPFAYGAVRVCLQDYRGWLDLGPGGLPYNVFGWSLQWFLKLTIAKRDTTGVGCYDKALRMDLPETESRRNATSYLDSLPLRDGERPKLAHWALPHRQQRKASTSTTVAQAYRRAFNDLAQERRATTSVAQSALERRGDAIFVAEPNKPPIVAARSRGEITHIHESENSAHVMLSFADCKEVIQKGWGERHSLSGLILPLGYTFLYAPETDADIEVIKSIMNAAISYMTDS